MSVRTGTVTFLFTDVEGSTRLWERQPESMPAALAWHDTLVRSTLEEHGGHVFKSLGDGFCAAFAAPLPAVIAALQIQRVVAREEALSSFCLRIALHTGTVEQRDGEYFGLPLSRVARLLSAAHGGQVLVCGVTEALVRDQLPASLALLDLGQHRLKDLTHPEHIFQLQTEDLPREFPRLRTLDVRLHQLPLQPTPLIGREKEIRELVQRLRSGEVRLLTLTGPGGTGKTRLALQAAAELADAFEAGVHFVNLAPLTDPALVASAIAQALGVKEAPGRALLETLRQYLRDRTLLLLLDNFERVADAGPRVADLLATAPQLKVLVTSRVPLHVRGEHEYAVLPLALPDSRRPLPLERWSEYDALRLFVERAKSVKADFAVTHENASAVAELCQRLDGLPLAIELAAARIKILTPQAMLSRMGSRLTLLTGGARDLPSRQQTLRNTLEWSHGLLGETERVLFRRLSVFAGGLTLDAVESVCSAERELDALDGIASLVDKSLLRQEEDASGEPRFVMLETIHEYASEKLEESDEGQRLRRRHAEHFLALTEQAELQLTGHEQGRWLSRLEAEHDNLRAALQRLLEQKDFETAARLAGALRVFWFVRGHLREGRQWLGEALAGEGLARATRAKALYGAGVLAWQQGDPDAAEPFLGESLVLCRALEDTRGIAWALTGLGILAAGRGDLARAESLYEEALSHYRELGERGRMAAVLSNLGIVAAQRQQYARSESLFQESLTLARQAGHATQASVALLNLADLARRQGELRQARAYLHESLRLAREIGLVQWATDGLALLAQILGAAGEPERAARLFGVVEARFAALGSHVHAPDRAEYDRDLSAVRAQMEPEAWERFYQEGAAWSLEEAVGYALEEDAGPERGE